MSTYPRGKMKWRLAQSKQPGTTSRQSHGINGRWNTVWRRTVLCDGLLQCWTTGQNGGGMMMSLDHMVLICDLVHRTNLESTELIPESDDLTPEPSGAQSVEVAWTMMEKRVSESHYVQYDEAAVVECGVGRASEKQGHMLEEFHGLLGYSTVQYAALKGVWRFLYNLHTKPAVRFLKEITVFCGLDSFYWHKSITVKNNVKLIDL